MQQTKSSNGGAQKAAGDRIESYRGSAHEAVDRAADAAERVGEQLDSLAQKRDELIDMPVSWLDEARDYVRENPLQSVGIALAAGYLLSVLMRSSGR